MPMITITDDTNTNYMANISNKCLIYKNNHSMLTETHEKIMRTYIFIKDKENKTFTLEYNNIEKAQKVWDRLCEITGANDILMKRRNIFRHH